ncbi:glutaredoxin family protein [Streptomyces sp. NPDC048251]|uniref:glutaredoxin family protein n=1 Tax=Streptomyces sp. NPDC048251 TaxID=3154501 RepID=UPI003419C012
MTPTTSSDLPKTTHAMPTITIYGPHECPNCEKAMKHFDRCGITYTKIDLEPGDSSHRHVTEKLGYEQTPVITVGFQGPPHRPLGRAPHGHAHDPHPALHRRRRARKRRCLAMTTAVPTIGIELTEHQQAVLLDALYDKSIETDRYLSAFRDAEEPGPLDSCCAAHLARSEERSAQRAVLLERKQHVRSAIGIVDGAVPAVWNNAVPRDLADALRDREDDESVPAAEWLAEHENDELWSLIGGPLDRITEFADPEGGQS